MEAIHLDRVPVTRLESSSPYCARYSLEDEALQASIQRLGVCFPVLAQADSLTLIAGHKRVHAARACGVKDLPVLLLEGAPSPRDLYILSLLSNWRQQLSDLDRVWALHRAGQVHGFEEKELLTEIIPLLGLPSGRQTIEEARSLKLLDTSVLLAIAAGRIAYRGAAGLAGFSSLEQLFFVNTIAAQAAFSSSQAAQAVEWLRDLTKLEGLDLESYWKKGFPDWDSGVSRDRKAAGEKAFQRLRELRFPKLCDRQKR